MNGPIRKYSTLLAIDPGLKPGAVELDMTTGAILRVTHNLDVARGWRAHWDIVATERQWYYGPKKGPRYSPPTGRTGPREVDVNDLLTLAFRAGWTLRDIPATRRMAIKPQVWRGVGSALTKMQVQNNIARDLTTAQKALFSDIPPSRHGDILDAIGIGRCALRIAPTTTEYDWIK